MNLKQRSRHSKKTKTSASPILEAILCFVMLTGCGHKRRLLYQKEEQLLAKDALKVLDFPTVTAPKLTHTGRQNLLTWHAPTSATYSIAGYNVYRFKRGFFIPKNPLNKQPITRTHYVDACIHNTTAPWCYAVRVIVVPEAGMLREGPVSQIVCSPSYCMHR